MNSILKSLLLNTILIGGVNTVLAESEIDHVHFDVEAAAQARL